MKRAMRDLLLLACLSLALLGAVPFPPGAPVVSEAEVFPVEPAVNEQRGFAVAVDGEWLALGARLEDVDVVSNAGAVHLYHFEQGTWKHKRRLTTLDVDENGLFLQENGQFGLVLALRGDELAVGAPGGAPGEGAAYTFARQGSEWIFQSMAASNEPGFGQSLSIDGEWLAVGSGDPHGQSPGSVHLYRITAPGESVLAGAPGERFGHSVSLRDNTLVVGAPGADGSKGTAYVYKLTGETWSRIDELKDPDGAEGDQLGFAVATNGEDVVVGAPTAGTGNAGAVGVWRAGDGFTKLTGSTGDGEQLGYAVAIDGDRIAAGAPFGGKGSVALFTRTGGAWSEGTPFEAESAADLDLSGFSVAVSGEWVILGSVLGDQGGESAGSASTIRCRPDCRSWSELAVPGKAADEVFGISVAADGDVFAVGARSKDLAAPRGSVTVFRRADQGWRQEIRLASVEDRDNEFGAAVALAGDLLVVGDPRGAFAILGGDPGPFIGGGAYLFRRKKGTWELETRLSSPDAVPLDRFGRAVATDGRTIVVGAGGSTGAAYVFELQQNGSWSEGVPLAPDADLSGDAFGSAVAVQGNTIAVGAPFAQTHDGEVHVFERGAAAWEWRTSLASGSLDEEFGSAVSLSTLAEEKHVLAVGAPRHKGFAGEAYVLEGSGKVWPLQALPHDSLAKQVFGTSVAVRGKRLVVGAPVIGFVALDTDRAYFYQRKDTMWEGVSVDALPRVPTVNGERSPTLDNFGTAVAIGEDFFVVTSPGSTRGDRVAVFELPEEVTP